MFKIANILIEFIFLNPLSVLYRLIVCFRNCLYKHGILRVNILPGKVISIGNIEAGGTGKTPLVKFIAEKLSSAGRHPAILTRGYKSGLNKDQYFVLLNGVVIGSNFEIKDRLSSDEPYYLSASLKNIPIIVGAKRFRNALLYYKNNRAITDWILDDGFQHRSVYRDIDIVILSDAVLNQSKQKMLPAGLFREPFKNISRAKIVMLRDFSKELLPENLYQYLQNKTVFQMHYTQSKPKNVSTKELFSSRHGSIGLISAVGYNHRVLRQLNEQSISVNNLLFGTDHKKFNVSKLKQFFIQNQTVLMTAKDFYRQEADYQPYIDRIYLLDLIVRIDKNDDFIDLL